MRILVTGASGFIASQIVRDLMLSHHQVTCCVRDVEYTSRLFPQAKIIQCDFYKDTEPKIWQERLKDIDLVINAVGILSHPNDKKVWQIHYHTPHALFTAAAEMGIKKVIQISALGIEESDSSYAKSKLAADRYLLSLPIDSIIVRPSLVYGRGSHGGSSFFRALAAFPCFIPIPGDGKQKLQPIHIEDLSKALIELIDRSVKGPIVYAVGPEVISLTTYLKLLRQWLKFENTSVLHIPKFLVFMISLFGQWLPNSVSNLNAYSMLAKDNISDEQSRMSFQSAIGFTPLAPQVGIFLQDSTIQDRWHARSYFLKPMLRWSLALMWLMSALTSAFFYPKLQTYRLLSVIGIGEFWQPVVLYSACMVNFMIFLALLFNLSPQRTGMMQIIVIVLYTALISIYLPAFWLEPFGPIVKNIPLLVAVLISMAWAPNR